MLEIIVSSVIGVLSGVIGTYAMLRMAKNKGFFLDIFEDFIYDIADNEDLQKKVYLIGGLLGSGVRQGVGIGKKGGKLSLENLVMQFIQGYIAPKVLGQVPGGPGQTAPPMISEKAGYG